MFHTETISMTQRRWGDQEMRSQRPFGVCQSPAEGNPPAALAHRAGVPPVEATGVGMREIRM